MESPGLRRYIAAYNVMKLSPSLFCAGQRNMDIPDDRKAALESLPVETKRMMMQPTQPRLQTKDPGEYLGKMKQVVDAGKDHKVLGSFS